jgi:hypothetical protein
LRKFNKRWQFVLQIFWIQGFLFCKWFRIGRMTF